MVVAATMLLTPSRAGAQETAKKESSAKVGAAHSGTGRDRAPIVETERVSTEQAARAVAEREANKKRKEQPPPKAAAPSGVTELQPTSNPRVAPPAEASSPSGKKWPLKDVHGSVYGGMDSSHAAAHRTGGELGASTRSGKTSVYVQTEQRRSNSQPPQ